MSLKLQPPTPLDYFAALVQSDEHFPLLEAAACIAQDEYPETDPQQVLGEMDQLLARLQRRLAADAGPLQRLQVLNRFFFTDLGFAGNLNDYHDPDNSYLHRVLQTRRGIPISLAVLWLELAQGLGLEAHGVGFPGHFLVKVHMPRGLVVLDPFTGQSLGREELAERLEPFQGRLPEEFEVPLGLYLQAAAPREIVARMLHNLKEIHRAQEDWPRMLAVQERLVILLPDAWAEWRDRGLVYAELGDVVHAVHDLDMYVRHAGDSPDHGAIAQRLAELRERLR